MRANYWSQTTSFSSSILKVRYVYWDQASLFVFSKPTEYLWCDGYKEKEKPITISSLITSASIQQPSLLSSSKGLENIMIQRNHCWIKTLKENFLFICLSRPPPLHIELSLIWQDLDHDDKICQALGQKSTPLSSWGEVMILIGVRWISIFLVILKLGSEDNPAL